MRASALTLLTLSLLLGCSSGCSSGGARGDDKVPDANNGAEVVGPDGVLGFRSVHALFYVVPIAALHGGGVVLVDTGFDESGADLAHAIAGRKVRAVLLTHSHVDHWSGVATLGDVPVYIGTADADLLEGRRRYRSFAQTLVSVFWPTPALPTRLIPVVDQQVVKLDGFDRNGDGDVFVARHLPGHTAGSTVWLWRDIAFTGDALFGDDDGGVSMAPALLSDDDDDARAAVSALWGIDATVLLDGHGGRTDDAAAHIGRTLNRGLGPHTPRRDP